LCSATSSAAAFAKARKLSFLDTKSVSQLTSTRAPVVPLDEAGNHAFGGHAAGGLASLGAQLDAQQLFGALHVAFGLGQGLLALHHGGVGLGAQFGDHACGDLPFVSPCGPSGSVQINERVQADL
jgi:hypothetical protein